MHWSLQSKNSQKRPEFCQTFLLSCKNKSSNWFHHLICHSNFQEVNSIHSVASREWNLVIFTLFNFQLSQQSLKKSILQCFSRIYFFSPNFHKIVSSNLTSLDKPEHIVIHLSAQQLSFVSLINILQCA